MSLASQDLAEARARRHQAERAELESRHQAEYELSLVGVYGSRMSRLLDATKAQREVMTDTDKGRVRVTYEDGVYSVTR